MNALTVHGLALLAYIAASVLYGAGLALRSSTQTQRARIALIVGVAIHTLAIGAFCVQTKQSPFASAYGTLSVAAWVTVLIYVPIEIRAKAPALGAVAAPLASLLLFRAILRSAAVSPESPQIRSTIISSHVFVVIISFALFVIAACCAVFYLWQYSALKHPDRRAMFRKLPPLETVDSLAYHLVSFAVPLLTLGLALGIIRAAGSGQPNWWLDAHTLLSLLAWAVYSGYLAARIGAGWRGARLNYLLLAGLAVTLAIFFVPSVTHRFT